MPTPKRIFYQFFKSVCRGVFTLGWRLSIRGLEHIPASGPLIVAANHRSYADPPLVGCAIPREVHFLAKKELFSFGPFGWLIRSLNAHPLDRAGDVAAFKLAKRLLISGQVLIVFPEGKRIKVDELARAKAGVGLLAISAGAPVVPVYVHNSGHMFRGKKISLVFGAPLDSRHFESPHQMTDAIMQRIQELKDAVLSSVP